MSPAFSPHFSSSTDSTLFADSCDLASVTVRPTPTVEEPVNLTTCHVVRFTGSFHWKTDHLLRGTYCNRCEVTAVCKHSGVSSTTEVGAECRTHLTFILAAKPTVNESYYSAAVLMNRHRVFHDVKNITQSSLHPTQPNPWMDPTHDQLWDALSVLCAQLTRDLLAIAKFMYMFGTVKTYLHESASFDVRLTTKSLTGRAQKSLYGLLYVLIASKIPKCPKYHDADISRAA